MPKALPSPELLRKLLSYEPETGKLFWRRRTIETKGNMDHRILKSWNTRFADKEAFTADNGKGYRCGPIFCELFFAHRIIWCIHYGRTPLNDIDHIDGNRSNNRIVNLREVTRSQNLKNTCIRSDNTSGTIGVSFDKSRQKWKAYIEISGKTKLLGRFADQAVAIEVRKAAERKHGYSANHGRPPYLVSV